MKNPEKSESFSIELNKVQIDWKLDKGTFSFFGINSVLFWINPSMQTLLQPLAGEIGHDMYRLMVAYSASQGTKEDYHAMVTTLGDTFVDGFLAWGKAVSTAGWGHFEVSEYDYENKKATVIVRNTWELLLQENVKDRLGCPFIQGKIIGIFSHALGVNCWADENRINYTGEDKFVEFKVYQCDKTIEKEINELRKQRMRDEEKALAMEIDKKTIELKEAQNELEEYSRNLEKKVAERTLELNLKNIRLNEMLDDVNEAKAMAEAANSAKSEFLANMSHEIRTPLNAVTGFSELLTSLVSDEKQKSYLKAIKTAGRSLLTLINDILDLSKIEAGEMDIKYAPVNPLIIFDEIEQIFKMKAAQNKLEFITDIDKDLPSALLLDETRLRQVLLNMVGNSIKFTDKGHIKLSAKKMYKNDEKSSLDLEISVEDTGIGISLKDQKRIFESFRQQHGQSTRKFGGTGLGLSISKKLVEIMNGRLRVESEPGKGSTFKILLQSVYVSSYEYPEVCKETEKSDRITFNKAKILVVDDVESNRILLNELLKSVNLEVLLAENGQEAVLLAKEYLPDLILMDLRMPVMDGIEATKEIKNNSSTKDIPVIALTASAKLSDQTKISESGFDGLLSKPVRINNLISELTGYLKHSDKGESVKETEYRFKEIPVTGIKNLKELACSIKNEILPGLPELQGTLIMGDIVDFGKKLKSLGEKHNCRQLEDFGDNMVLFTGNFDILKINKYISEFPEIVKNLLRVNGGQDE